jgi:hypothetical protein
MRGKRLLWLAPVCALILLALPSNVIAGTPMDPNIGDTWLGTVGGLRYATDSGAFSPTNHFASVQTGCGPQQWHLLGGGSSAGGPANQAWIAADRPDDFNDPDFTLDDGWLSGGFGAASGMLKGYSVCIQGDALRYRSANVPSSSSELRSGSIGCNGDKWHVASGSAFIATSNSWVSSSYPMDGPDKDTIPDDGWKGAVYDTVGGFGGFSVFAECTSAHHLRYAKAGPFPVQPGTTGVFRVPCLPSEHVVGGGARLFGPQNRGRLLSSFPVDGPDTGKVPDDGWQSSVYNVAGGAKKVTAFAVCLS